MSQTNPLKMTFKIAEHLFSLAIPERYSKMLNSYLPFESDDSGDILYSVEVVDSVTYQITKSLYEQKEGAEPGMSSVNIYETTEGILYDILSPYSTIVNARLHIVGRSAQIWIDDQSRFSHALVGFNNAMILSYITYTMPLNTLLIHASAIVKDKKAHLFIGKSGTGKSTHSQMWRASFPDAELLNDDHPVVRCHPNGEVIAYGSPWSGKTACYLNRSAPLRAIIRICRADHNRLIRLETLRSYASVMTSCTAAQWSEDLAAAKVASLESVIRSVGCYNMECLPNPDAAKCCYESLCAEEL